MHPLRATPCQQHGLVSNSSRRQQLAVLASSQSGGNKISRRLPRNPLQLLQAQHQQQQQQPLVPVTDTTVSLNNSTAVASSLKFAKHLSNVSNGVAPPSSRMESLGWLLFETKHLQASTVICLSKDGASDPAAWLRSADSLQLLEQIYMVGAAIAELGTADGLQPLSVSNGARAIVSLDYSRLLERYLAQHGQVLTEQFWCGLAAHDDLQARAIHVATALETRCMVHAMLFNKLIERVGTEGGGLITAGGWSAHVGGGGGGPLATAITNNLINTTQQHSAPVTTQSTVAAPSAVTSNSGNNSNTATAAATTSSTPGAGSSGFGGLHSIVGWVGQVGAIFLLLCTVAGKLVHVVIAVVNFGKDVVMQLLMLRAVSAGAKAVAAKAAGAAGRGGKLQPAFAGAAAGGALPPPVQQQHQLLPADSVAGIADGSNSSAALQPVSTASWQQPMPAAAAPAAVATPAVFSTGSLGLLGAVPLQQQQQQQQHIQPAAAVNCPQQPQQPQQQWRLEPAVVQPTAAWPGSPTAAELPTTQHQHQASSKALAAAAAGSRKTPRLGVLLQQQHVLRSGLASGLGSAQQLLRRAAAKVVEKAAALPDILQQQQQHGGSKPFNKGSMTAVVGRGVSNSSSNSLLYSLWSPSDAGLQDLKAAAAAFEGPAGAAAGVPFADAGWGLAAAAAAAAGNDVGGAGSGSSNGGGMGVVGQSAEEGGW